MKSFFASLLSSQFTIRAAVAATMFMVAATSALAADDMKNLPGAACVSTTTTAPTFTSNAEAENRSASTLTFVCPIVRGEQQLLGLSDASIWVHDRHYNSNVCCSSRSKDPGGQSVKFTSDKCSTGVETSRKLDFAGPVPSGTWSARFFLCSVPGLYQNNPSAVLAYRSKEI